MPEHRTIKIDDDYDMVVARMQTRQAASVLGFNLKDQACISLAAWSLAYSIGMGKTCRGAIVIEPVRSEARTGMRVICTTSKPIIPETLSDAFDKTRWMVDELVVKSLPGRGLEVTVTKWQEVLHAAD